MGAGFNGIIFNDLEWPLTQFSRSWHFWNRICQKRCVLGTMLLEDSNRRPYTIYRMVPLSMTLSDLCPGFQGHDIFWSWISCLKDKVTIAQEDTIPNIWNATVWWPWLTSKRVARVCQHQLSFFICLSVL